MPGPARALKKCGNGFWGAELANQIDISDIDAEFERGGRNQRLELSRLKPLLRKEPLLFGEATVMCADIFAAQPLGQMAGRALHHPPRVHENQRRAMGFD